MKRGYKDIEHKKYSAPTKTRRKVKGEWVYEKLAGGFHKFAQRVQIRVASMSKASRWIPYALGIISPSYHDYDALVRKLLLKREERPSFMAKKKFYVHRPKPANNTAKNAARRERRKSWLIANEPKMKSPTGHLGYNIMSASQVRMVIAQDSTRFWRRICGDRTTGRRNSYWGRSQSGIGARECERRRRQMGTGEFKAEYIA